MDRNLGAMDIYCHVDDGRYGDLYYQFGRKDPLLSTRKTYVRQTDGLYSIKELGIASYAAAGEDLNNVPYSIHHPEWKIQGSDAWTQNDKYNPNPWISSIRWQDPYVTTTEGKSMFDPCPTGWRIPEIEIWTGFNKKVDGKYSNTIYDNHGIYYYPIGINTNVSIYFPANGYNYFGYGGWNSSGNVYIISANSNSTSGIWHAEFSPTVINVKASYGHTGRGSAYNVRCVQE